MTGTPGLEVAGGELGAGDAGADDDEVLGHLVEVVDVAPVEDPLAVGLGAGQHPRVGAGGDEDDVALQLLGDRAVVVEHLDPVRGQAADLVGEPALPGDDPHALAGQPGVDVGGLGHRQALDPVVDRRRGRGSTVASSAPCSPRTAESRTEVMAPAAAMRVLEGTQSVRTLAPPMPSRSMTVTCAPSCAATSAAS